VNIPPFQSPDEDIHFFRSWALALGQIKSRSTSNNFLYDRKNDNLTGFNEKNSKGFFIPAYVSLLPEKMEFSRIVFKVPEKFAWERVSYVFKETNFDYKDLVPYNDWMNVVNPIAYFRQVLAILIVKLFNYNPIYSLYLGRIFNLIFAYFLIFLSIKIAPLGKNVFATLSVLPITVSLMASFNHDAILIPLGFIYIALILREIAQPEKVNFKKLLFPFIVLNSLVLIKGIYFPVFLIFLAIPKEKFVSKKIRAIFFTVFALSTVLTAFISNWMWGAQTEIPKQFGADPARQFMEVAKAPFNFMGTFLFSFNEFSIQYIKQFIGILGYLDTELFNLTYIFFIILLIFFIKSSDEEKPFKFSILQRIIFFISSAACFFGIFFTMYLTLNPVGNKYINGPQSRTFLPFFPLVIFSFYGLKLNKKTRSLIFIIGLIILLYLAQKSINIRFYGIDK
jgi:uncharacterized membrane protein